MRKIFRTAYHFLIALPGVLTPAYVARRIDPERYSIDQFIHKFVVPNLSSTDRVLDAGAGSLRYKPALDFTRYESTDFEDIFDQSAKEKHDFLCSLDDIPKPDNTYDAIVNTQVLEHVEYPQKVIREFYRVLKPGGKLFLTTNQMWGVHGAPYNFYFYTSYGLQSLFQNAGFTVIFVRPRGGIFWLLAKLIREFPTYIFYQHAFGGYKRTIRFKPRFQPSLAAFLLFPFYLILQFLTIPLALILFWLDPLDQQKYFTLGYTCYCIKES